MTVVVVALVALAVFALLFLVHRWLWIRLVRDTTTPGSRTRRTLTAAAWALPLLAVAALVSERAGAPFWLQQTVAWPGFLWLAALLYLTLSMLLTEPIRALWLRRHPSTEAPSAPPALTDPAPPAFEARVRAEPDLPARPALEDRVRAEPGFGKGRGGELAPQGSATAIDPAPAEGDVAVTAPDPAPATGDTAEPAAAGAATPRGLTRRTFVARTLAAAALATTTATLAHGTHSVLRGPRVKRITVPLAKLPRAAHGFRVAVVSDIHLGPILGRAHSERIVETINRTQPDLIAIVGDLVDGSVENLGPAAEPLARLRARHGAYFVTGNHEYFSGAQQWVDHVRELGLHPLENARRELPHFDLAGVNDIAGEREGQGPDFARALGDRDRARTAVLLAHQPVVIHDAVAHGVDLQLSGHTHGGQLWPGNYLAELANPTLAGLERYGDTQLYVSRGAGAWGPPVRVGAPSDITVVELASYQA
ncbi:metallophosphoesterase [Streptomyces sp. NPDC051211]|uniref:metallophosphoesterase n=1 Tax=Streptomyces sp. NPDC051211 TaxID=3154643 RepID=UPI00344DEC0B